MQVSKKNQANITLYLHHEEKNEASAFFEKYNVTNHGTTNIRPHSIKLQPRKARKCRFCGRSYPETTFKNAAHSIPHFLGNRYLLNDFECDKCNDIFSKYETSLGDYLLLKRVFNGTKGKRGIPKVESFDKTEIISNDDGIISVVGKNLNSSKNGIINKSKTTYIPIHIYKTFVKLA